MKLRILGCSGAELPNFHPPAILIDEILLLDAGTIGAVLDEDEQRRLEIILVSHAHLDHIRGIPALAENIILEGTKQNVTVAGTREILAAICRHLMNDVVWPDFSRIPSAEMPVITYLEMEPGRQLNLNNYEITAFPVHHSIPAVGYIIRKGGKALLYTGDTGPTELIWQKADGVTSLIVEVSFPNRMEKLALQTGHLTANLMVKELRKMKNIPPAILITHIKPQFFAEIEAEIAHMNLENVQLLADGSTIEL